VETTTTTTTTSTTKNKKDKKIRKSPVQKCTRLYRSLFDTVSILVNLIQKITLNKENKKEEKQNENKDQNKRKKQKKEKNKIKSEKMDPIQEKWVNNLIGDKFKQGFQSLPDQLQLRLAPSTQKIAKLVGWNYQLPGDLGIYIKKDKKKKKRKASDKKVLQQTKKTKISKPSTGTNSTKKAQDKTKSKS